MPFDCRIKPGEIIKIPLGYGIEIPDGFAGYVFPRSSMALKGLICELPPIDSGYRGEIHAIISNVSNSEYLMKKDTRWIYRCAESACPVFWKSPVRKEEITVPDR